MIDSLPDQVILWDNPDGTRQSEHRSIGDADQQCWWYVGDALRGIDVFVRKPRPDDRFWAACCTAWGCNPGRTTLGGGSGAGYRIRPVVLAVFGERDDAYEFAEAHANVHMLAREPFRRRQGELYRRQARLERALCG
jgi:hypothetical protein